MAGIIILLSIYVFAAQAASFLLIDAAFLIEQDPASKAVILEIVFAAKSTSCDLFKAGETIKSLYSTCSISCTPASLKLAAAFAGPHISPQVATFFNNKPVRVYKPNLDRNLIGLENKNRTVIYKWVNLINGKMYVGSGWIGSRRLLSY